MLGSLLNISLNGPDTNSSKCDGLLQKKPLLNGCQVNVTSCQKASPRLDSQRLEKLQNQQ